MPKEKSKGIIPRPPVVAIMGHIDHGKSTLLDYIRKTNVVGKEAGGITQHISAYEVIHKDEKGNSRRITFLDTPGHEAFKAMRKRGAGAADVAVLVVSAEDGVKPQTLEAFSAITDSKTPYIVAINKIDKPGANIEKTKQTLLDGGIYIEGYGGNVPSVSISAKKGEGVKELLDMILLVADLESLSGNPEEKSTGVIIESNLDTKKGITATLIIKNGTLKKGEFIVAGESMAPVRIMENFLGEAIPEATFSSPVRIIGWSDLPKAGEIFSTYKTKKEAEEATQVESKKLKEIGSSEFSAPVGAVVIPLVIKTDMLGSSEAIAHEIKKIETDTVKVKIVEASAGTISENDVKFLTGAPNGIIVGFAVKADARAIELAERQGVVIKTFDVIYKLTEWLEEIIKERTPKVEVQEIEGALKVLKTFSRTKDKQVIGGRIESGKIRVGDKVKIKRRDAEVGEGTVKEIQVQKLKVREVTEGSECGLQVEAKIDIAQGDILQSVVLSIK
jgi:translation initiation factor IF-2